MQSDLHDRIKDFLEGIYGGPLDFKVDDQIAFAVIQQMDTLSAREVEVLCRRYGITESAKTYHEIAQQTGKQQSPLSPITRSMARQIHLKALRRMRHPCRLAKIAKAGGIFPN